MRCDKSHMEEVLSNLVRNALDAMGGSGTLTLEYRRPRKNIILILVKDTGKGIPENQLSHIFEPYHSGYSDGRHMGMGLYYCQNVLHAHGGYIQVKSSTEPEHHGTVFILCIPAGRRNLSPEMEN